MVSGGLIVRAAQGSHDSMWRSVPQIPVLWTRISTSLMPTGGIGTSRRSRPGPAPVFTRASIGLGASFGRRPLGRLMVGQVLGRLVVYPSVGQSAESVSK